MSERIAELQNLIKSTQHLHLNREFLDYQGVAQYYPEELVIVVKAGTPIVKVQQVLAKNNQVLSFYVEKNQSIGAAFANGEMDLSDSVLGVQIIDGTGEVLNFGGQVIKNVAGYDVSRLLVGSKGQLALITEISLKVLPKTYASILSAPTKRLPASKLSQKIAQQLKQVFDPRGIFH